MDTKSAFNKIIWKSDSKNKNPIKLKLNILMMTMMFPGLLLSVLRVRLLDHNHFLAIEKDGEFVHDNFDFDLKPQIWHYAFHDDTLP